MRCIYCQNHPWSQEHQGNEVDVDGLRSIFLELARAKCHNWNLVSPTPWLPWIGAALSDLERDGIRLPIVYNTSGFEAAARLDQNAPWIDVALVDLRYARAETAKRASDCPDYVEQARSTLSHLCRRLGPLKCDADGVARRGTICRILVLPGHADEAVDNLRWIAETLGNDLHVSLMAQYTPAYRATRPPWNRRLESDEYERVCLALEEFGFENGWVQSIEEPDAGLLGFAMPPGAGTAGKWADE